MKRWIGIGLVMLALSGCGSDAGDPDGSPAFDLTGRWVAAKMDCETSSDDLPDEAVAQMNAEIEREILASPGAAIEQDGSALVITDLETGEQADGTIVGDEVSYVESEEGEFAGVTGSIESVVEGTAVDADTIEGTADIEWQVTVEGLTFMGETLCDVRFERVEGEDA